MCAGNNECLFDIASIGLLEVGLQTNIFAVEAQQDFNISANASPADQWYIDENGGIEGAYY